MKMNTKNPTLFTLLFMLLTVNYFLRHFYNNAKVSLFILSTYLLFPFSFGLCVDSTFYLVLFSFCLKNLKNKQTFLVV